MLGRLSSPNLPSVPCIDLGEQRGDVQVLSASVFDRWLSRTSRASSRKWVRRLGDQKAGI